MGLAVRQAIMRIEAAFMATLFLAACGGAEPPPEPAPPEPRATVFDPLVGTLERAEGVQQTVDDQAAELRRRLEEAER
jgi:hypothetical protein